MDEWSITEANRLEPKMLDFESILEIISGKRTGVAPSLIRAGLWAATPCYRFAIARRNRRFDLGFKPITNVSVPVISIGNLTTGGTGKTPLVVLVAELLKQHQRQPVILSRGYRGENGKNDEALELEQRLPDVPHLQDPDRVSIAQQAIGQHHANVLILDDGFQHRYLHRDLDIVLIDATNPFGFGYLLPRGLLREPVSSLRRADLVVITRTGQVTPESILEIRREIQRWVPDRSIFESRTTVVGWQTQSGQLLGLDQLDQKRVFAFCGIGNPAAFSASLNDCPVEVCGNTVFADHHHYSAEDLRQLSEAAAGAGAEALVCTHKDLVKLPGDEINGLPVLALRIETRIAHRGAEFTKRVLQQACDKA